jgi:hypothetical protein
MNEEKHTAAEAAPDAPERTAQTEKTPLILAPGLVSTNSATQQLVYERRQGKDAEVFVGADEGADDLRSPILELASSKLEAKECVYPVLRLRSANKGL